MLGPILGGILSTALGIRPIFLITGTALILLAGAIGMRYRDESRKSSER